ncbi:SDR family oxidoreductase [Streptomyces sp. SID12501]|uniref:SDR family oxidoreductase n=1 Tax=Streptomyces sp. SID12501 TaxID=2706042 RepID=A0A6B3C5H5_9ACTN|nr:SDR family oxidoreductase [Streptomyces sp. SID12501]NEC92013.1 SDR family oxidoreductase [Streptomyces sp. SID12501]
MAQNLLTAVLTTVALQDKLTGGGCVISIGSVGAECRGGSYGAAKTALAAWNASLSAGLAPEGITCNVISAGFVADTNFFQGGLTEERHRALAEEAHNKRPGTVDDIAQTAYFLASPGPATSPARPSTSTEAPSPRGSAGRMPSHVPHALTAAVAGAGTAGPRTSPGGARCPLP